MNRCARTLLALLLPVLARGQTSPTTLVALRDNFRPLLIFAGSPDDPSLLAQLHRLKDSAPDLHERQILVIAVPFHNPAPTDVSLSATDATDARRRFGIAPADFTVILLGKDGGEKLRSSKPIAPSKLRDTVDSMPMRQEEIERGPKP